tara:strand:+ start:4809 stop:5327 length:519 start_codon:yes stop_codon:yes gene_type:complete
MQTLLQSKFTGIIQVSPADDAELLVLQDAVLAQYSDQQPNPKLHITLLHQSFPKKVTNADGLRGDKALKALFKNGGHMGIPTPNLQLGDVKMGFDLIKDRRSSYVVIENSVACLELRDAILQAAGIDPADVDAILTEEERTRVFHISLTNLEGNGGASIAYPQAGDTNVVIR